MAISAIGLAGTAGSAAVPVACTASGSKFVAMSEAQVCTRFVATLGREMRQTTLVSAKRPADGYAVELSFLPQGVASAKVSRLRGGRALELPLYQLAVSDRKMLSTDIDKLASDAAHGIAQATRAGRG
jgi:hypothetical protein